MENAKAGYDRMRTYVACDPKHSGMFISRTRGVNDYQNHLNAIPAQVIETWRNEDIVSTMHGSGRVPKSSQSFGTSIVEVCIGEPSFARNAACGQVMDGRFGTIALRLLILNPRSSNAQFVSSLNSGPELRAKEVSRWSCHRSCRT